MPGTKAETSTLELAFQDQWLFMNKLILLIALFIICIMFREHVDAMSNIVINSYYIY